jgi:enoyl-CoA hydratase/carnithine racemase
VTSGSVPGQAGGIGFRVEGSVAVLTIDRPLRANAIAPETAAELHALVRRVEEDESVRAAVLTGSGDRVFCAGSDLRAKAGGASPAVTAWGFAGFVKAPRAKPFVAAVNGVAMGGGFELVLACDLSVAAPHAEFALPEVRRGLVPGGGGLVRLPKRLPAAIATEILLAGRVLTAPEALRYGLVNRVVPATDVLAQALGLAHACAQGAPIAVRECLAVARTAEGTDDGALWRRSELASATVAASADGSEGPRAFTEKRPPVWQGR